LSKLEALRVNPASSDPEEQCRAVWSVLRPIYVVDPADVEKLDGWQRCHLETERTAMTYFRVPSALDSSSQRATCQV
jgi:hypothetical protein